MMLSADVQTWKQKGQKSNVSVKPRRFLFETRRDVFPEGYLTQVEIGLWTRFYDWAKQEYG